MILVALIHDQTRLYEVACRAAQLGRAMDYWSLPQIARSEGPPLLQWRNFQGIVFLVTFGKTIYPKMAPLNCS